MRNLVLLTQVGAQYSRTCLQTNMVATGVGRIEHNGEILLSMRETTKAIGCSDEYVYKLAQVGKLDTRKVKGHRGKRYTLDSVVDHLASKRFRRGIGAEDMAEAFHKLERRVRMLESKERRRGAVDGPVNEPANPVGQVAIDAEVRKRHPDAFN